MGQYQQPWALGSVQSAALGALEPRHKVILFFIHNSLCCMCFRFPLPHFLFSKKEVGYLEFSYHLKIYQRNTALWGNFKLLEVNIHSEQDCALFCSSQIKFILCIIPYWLWNHAFIILWQRSGTHVALICRYWFVCLWKIFLRNTQVFL